MGFKTYSSSSIFIGLNIASYFLPMSALFIEIAFSDMQVSKQIEILVFLFFL